MEYYFRPQFTLDEAIALIEHLELEIRSVRQFAVGAVDREIAEALIRYDLINISQLQALMEEHNEGKAKAAAVAEAEAVAEADVDTEPDIPAASADSDDDGVVIEEVV